MNATSASGHREGDGPQAPAEAPENPGTPAAQDPTMHAAALPAVQTPMVEDSVPPYVRRALQGEARAFRELFQLHRRDVLRLAARMVGPRADLEDLVQEVFIQVFRSLPSFRGESRFSTWLHRVTVNVVLMHLRAARSRPKLEGESAQEPTTPELESPIEGAARAERLRALYRILDTLSEKKRTVFILHDLEGTSATEIASIVDAPVLTVRTRLFYARREVYAAIAKDPTLDSVADELGLEDNGETP